MIRTLLRKAVLLAAAVTVLAALGIDGAGADNGGLLAAKTMTPKPGTVFRDCPQCPELIVVPAGIFVMGSNKTRKTEKPAHRVNFKRPFAIGRLRSPSINGWSVSPKKDVGIGRTTTIGAERADPSSTSHGTRRKITSSG